MKSQKRLCAEEADGILLPGCAPPNAWTISGNLTSVPDEEDRKIVPYKIVVAFFGIKFDGKATGIAHRVSRTPSSGYR